ncbi:hypothetical protein JTB14_009861 [Gonioctena quinquepunctata]|nr:hypothetical protein JTB14_009861 [Gonioctena quinquepunctata]
MLYDQKEGEKRNKEMEEKAKQWKNAKKLLGLASPKKNREKRSRRCEPDSESTSSEFEETVLDDDSDMDISDTKVNRNSDELIEEVGPPTPETIEIGDFLLVRFAKKKSIVHYVGKVTSKYSFSEFEITYLRKKSTSYVFIYPYVEDTASADIANVMTKLPKPHITKGTSQTASFFSFSFDFDSYNVQ